MTQNPVDQHSELNKLRRMIEFASICQFFQLFMETYGYEDLDSETLEDFILADYDSLTSLIFKLLKTATKNRISRLSLDTLLYYCSREFQKVMLPHEYPFEYNPELKLQDLALRQKVLLLNFLVEYQLEDPMHFRQITKYPPDQQINWRVLPFGYDKIQTYWLFDDSRLFKSMITKKTEIQTNGLKLKIKSQEPVTKWEPVCITESDWMAIVEKFKDSTNRREKDLHQRLVKVLPLILRDIQLHKQEIREKREKQELEELKKLQVQEKLERSLRSRKRRSESPDEPKKRREALPKDVLHHYPEI
ncbi:hypothetical protein HDV06_004835 [Boothiomyces sp. JEL0866]|nr:hypothetical protein HDV06_004835 [Boothiomyces sp. JEL0866]